MEIIALIVIFTLSRFVANGLFNSPKWRIDAQKKFDGIKRERIFWSLMNEKMTLNDKVIEHSIDDVFMSYLSNGPASFNSTSDDVIIKKMLVKDSSTNLAMLYGKIKEKDEFIERLLVKNQISFSKEELQKVFKEVMQFGDLLETSDGYKLIYDHFDLEEASGVKIWNLTKDLAYSYDYVYLHDRGRFDKNMILSFKFKCLLLTEKIISLLCAKVENEEEVQKLKKALTERNKFKMVGACIFDHSFPFVGSSKLGELPWRVAEVLFL